MTTNHPESISTNDSYNNNTIIKRVTDFVSWFYRSESNYEQSSLNLNHNDDNDVTEKKNVDKESVIKREIIDDDDYNKNNKFNDEEENEMIYGTDYVDNNDFRMINDQCRIDYICENIFLHVARILLWDDPRDSFIHVLAFNITYW